MTQQGPIVSLLPGATEILFGLNLAERVAAVSHQCDFPAAVEKLPRVTTSRVDSQQASLDIDRQVHSWATQTTALYRLDEKRIRALQPSLIITQAHCDVCASPRGEAKSCSGSALPISLQATSPDLSIEQKMLAGPEQRTGPSSRIDPVL